MNPASAHLVLLQSDIVHLNCGTNYVGLAGDRKMMTHILRLHDPKVTYAVHPWPSPLRLFR